MARRWLAKLSFLIRAHRTLWWVCVSVCVCKCICGLWVLSICRRCALHSNMCDSRTFIEMQGIFYSCRFSYGTFNPFSVCLNLPSHKIPIEWNANIPNICSQRASRTAVPHIYCSAIVLFVLCALVSLVLLCSIVPQFFDFAADERACARVCVEEHCCLSLLVPLCSTLSEKWFFQQNLIQFIFMYKTFRWWRWAKWKWKKKKQLVWAHGTAQASKYERIAFVCCMAMMSQTYHIWSMFHGHAMPEHATAIASRVSGLFIWLTTQSGNAVRCSKFAVRHTKHAL